MPRLPIPGSDKGSWGVILNDYLDEAHNADGSIKDVGVVAEKYVKPANGIPKLDLDSAVRASLDNADAAVSGTAPDASTSVKGLVQLSGDLGGTASSPTVPGLAAKADASALSSHTANTSNPHTVTKAQVGLANVDNTTDLGKPISTATQTALNLKAPLASPTFTGTVTVPAPTNGTDASTKTYVDTAVTTVSIPDADATTKGKIQLTGDLGGTAASPTVPALSSKVAVPTAWASGTNYAVGDYFSQNGIIFRTETTHTSTSTPPSVSNAQPTDPLSNYSVWAAPGNSPGSLLVRSAINEVTVEMMYVTSTPSAPSSAANKQYVDDQVASVTPPPRPSVPFVVIWSSPNWTYQGVTITARPGSMATGDIILFIGNPGGSLPAWAATNDLWTQG